MSALDYHYETVGRILEHIVAHGLGRIELESSDAMEIMTHRQGDEDEVMKSFTDVIFWMLNEGIIRVANIQELMDGQAYFLGVQLTSTGIAIIQQKPTDGEMSASVEDALSQSDEGGLSSDVYIKIGAFVGGALGGFTKAVS